MGIEEVTKWKVMGFRIFNREDEQEIKGEGGEVEVEGEEREEEE